MPKRSIMEVMRSAAAKLRIRSILEGDEEDRLTRVALAGAAAAQLAVDAARLVAFGADHEEAAEFGDAFAEFDVGAAAGHVGGDGDRALLAGAGDDLGLLAVVFGVEDGVRESWRA